MKINIITIILIGGFLMIMPQNIQAKSKFSDADKDLIEKIVMNEAGNQGTLGAMLVAECIMNAMDYENCYIPEVIFQRYGYTTPYRGEINEDVKFAVKLVFDYNIRAIESEKIMFFYAPKIVNSDWHESQKFVTEYKDHRFFARKDSITRDIVNLPTLKPCPLCGNKQVEVKALDCFNHAVICNKHKGGCGLSSGYERTEEEVIEIWNNRK